MINSVKTAAITFLLITVASAVVRADTPESSRQAAYATLMRMQEALNATNAISYSSVLTFSGLPSQQGPSVLHVSATVEKPDRATFQVAPVNKGVERIYCDGSNVSIYDSGVSMYSVAPAAATLQASIAGLYRISQALYVQEPEAVSNLSWILAFPITYESGDYHPGAPPDGIAIDLTCHSSTVAGRQLLTVEQIYKMVKFNISFSIAYKIDAKTYLPIELDEGGISAQGSPLNTVKQTFSNMKLSSQPLPAQTYAFIPPVGANELVLGAPVPPAGEPSIPSISTPPVHEATVTNESPVPSRATTAGPGVKKPAISSAASTRSSVASVPLLTNKSTVTLPSPDLADPVAPIAPSLPAVPGAPSILTVGRYVPDFSVQLANGDSIRLSRLFGKVVVVYFWATWCQPSLDALPHIDDIAKLYGSKPVAFLPVCSWDDRPSFQAYLQTAASLSLPFYYDYAGKRTEESIARKLFGVDGLPTTFVIGKDGRVVSTGVGYDAVGDPTESQLSLAIGKALLAP